MDLVYKERRKQQMLRFFGATAFTLISLRFTMRLLTTKVTKNSIFELNKNRYKPSYFQFNHKIPSELTTKYKNSDIKNDLGSRNEPGMVSIVAGTFGIASGLLLMGITGTLWISNVSTLDEWLQQYRT